jgi:hypothetical protein
MGAIPVSGFLAWYEETVWGYSAVVREATCYNGAKAGIELEIVVAHAQQSVFHDHLFCRIVDLQTHERLGYIGSASRLVLNGVGLSNIGARRQRSMGFEPVPRLLFTSKKDQEKGLPAVRVVIDWELLERRIKMRKGEFKPLEEMMKNWRSEGSDPKKDPSRLSRNLGLGEPWDIPVHDYIDRRVQLLRSTYPEAEPIFLEELEVDRERNHQRVKAAHVGIFRELTGLGWTREQIVNAGIEPSYDPLDVARSVAEGKAFVAEQERKRSVDENATLVAENAALRDAKAGSQAGPPFAAEEIIDALYKANANLLRGEGLDSITQRQREIVEIKPALRKIHKGKRVQGGPQVEANPFAGRVGLTNAVYAFVANKINLSRDPRFIEAFNANKTSMGMSLILDGAQDRNMLLPEVLEHSEATEV